MDENLGRGPAPAATLCRYCSALCFLLVCSINVGGRAVPPLPNEFLIGRHTFIDVGPPNDFYEIFSVQSTSKGIGVQKLTLTPAADACLRPPTIEFASAVLPDTMPKLLERRNPCAISERRLQSERNRRKHGLVFSGEDVSIELGCAGKERIIRADILDRDLFDSSAAIPENTSWTMRLLSRLDSALDSRGPLDQPLFAVSNDRAATGALPDDVKQQLASGQYDQLFNGVPERPSQLYRAAQVIPARPEVRLVSSVPFEPRNNNPPAYPPLARAAHIEGVVVVTAQVTASGDITVVTAEGHPMLREAAKDVVSGWTFTSDAANHQVKATFEFKLNCFVPIGR